MYKQVIVLRRDLGMSEGKKCVQSAHASIGAYQRADERVIEGWNSEGQKKIVVEVDSEEELLELFKKAEKERIPCFLVKDAGLTELKPGTITALGLGPEREEKLDKITRGLKLL